MARRIKATKKALATIMAVSMIMSSVNLSAFAAENEKSPAYVCRTDDRQKGCLRFLIVKRQFPME